MIIFIEDKHEPQDTPYRAVPVDSPALADILTAEAERAGFAVRIVPSTSVYAARQWLRGFSIDG